MTELLKQINSIVWGPIMLVAILGTGFFLTVRLQFLPLRKLFYGFQQLWSGRKGRGEGNISPFNALMTSLSATIGTGNIAGVATAIAAGGPGALFWMWCTALVGMATKYAEAVLAVEYREVDKDGNYSGGPMYYIKNGLGKKWAWLGGIFAVFASIAGFGIGNSVQANSVADVLSSSFGITPLATGITLTLLVGLVLLGGIKWISEVAGKLVPIMAISYLLLGLIILCFQASRIPSSLQLIFTSAFNLEAAGGGFLGAAIWLAIRHGVARGVFSNEAGLGSAPIAHAAAHTDSPVRQGMIAMLGTFIDTILVCSITGLVIVTSGLWNNGETGASLSSAAFQSAFPELGKFTVSIGLAIFAFTTILGWSYYGEKCFTYLFGTKLNILFRLLWVVAIPIGATMQLDLAWLISDTLNALMAVPNLLALVLLAPVVVKLSTNYFQK
ncbi:MAG: sodium:alanine symporter family protein [Verrucomicrobiota bacterium]